MAILVQLGILAHKVQQVKMVQLVHKDQLAKVTQEILALKDQLDQPEVHLDQRVHKGQPDQLVGPQAQKVQREILVHKVQPDKMVIPAQQEQLVQLVKTVILAQLEIPVH